MEYVRGYDQNHVELISSIEKEEARAQKYWVEVSHVWFIDSKKKKILLQKRSATKKRFPLCLDSAVGGHVSRDETFAQAAIRETYEETQIQLSSSQLVNPLYHSEDRVDGVDLKQHTCIYIVDVNFSKYSFVPEVGEIEYFVEVSKEELRQILENEPDIIVAANSFYWRKILNYIEKEYF